MAQVQESDRLSLSHKEFKTLDFYERNAEAYARQTAEADLSGLYERFLPLVVKGGRILDVGCGGGRDLKAFKARGFEGVGVDPSPRLARIAKEYSGCETLVAKVEEINFVQSFDAAWACASLLHLRRSLLPLALSHISNALKPLSVLFISMQEGNGEVVMPDGRLFVLYSSKELTNLVKSSGFDVIDLWRTKDTLPGRMEKRWVNLVAQCKSVDSDLCQNSSP